MSKKILEINSVDLLGKRWNGYDYLNELNSNGFKAKQIVLDKESNDKNVITFFDNEKRVINDYVNYYEQLFLSVHSNLSLTSPALVSSKEYKKADILHFHLIHNTKLSLYSLIEICNNKKTIISIHDPWFFTGRCVHPDDCLGYLTGCKNCPHLSTAFPMKVDYCNELWKLKEMVYKSINPHIIVSSKFMYDLLKNSPLTKHFTNVHLIPLGIDLKEFNNKISKEEARKKLDIKNNQIVLFLRAQENFKGTEYAVEALKKLKIDKNITILTCGEKGYFNDLKDKYIIKDLGLIETEKLINCYRACDIFLMPSIGESFGFMAVEAMACERPVIVFDNTALPSVTNAPEIGVLVENKNSYELMKAIKNLIDNEEERITRGKLGRKYAEEHYDKDKLIKELISLYNKILNEEHNINVNIENSVQKQDIEDVKYIKYELNRITTKLLFFSEDFRNLLYKKEEIKKKPKNYILKYSNSEVQKVINEYNKNLYEVTKKCVIVTDSDTKILIKLYNKLPLYKKAYFLVNRFFTKRIEFKMVLLYKIKKHKFSNSIYKKIKHKND